MFGWAAFATAFWFALNFYVSFDERLAEFGRYRATIDKQSIELKQVGRMNDSMTAALIATEPATRFYRDHLAHLEPSDRVPEDLLQPGARLAAQARRSIETAIGTIDGIEFADDQVRRYAAGLKSNLRGIDRSVVILETFFRAYPSKGSRAAIRELQAAHTWIFSDAADAVAGFTRLRSWHQTVSAASDALLADLDILQATSRSFTTRIRIAGLATTYCVSFLLFAAHSWRASRARC